MYIEMYACKCVSAGMHITIDIHNKIYVYTLIERERERERGREGERENERERERKRDRERERERQTATKRESDCRFRVGGNEALKAPSCDSLKKRRSYRFLTGSYRAIVGFYWVLKGLCWYGCYFVVVRLIPTTPFRPPRQGPHGASAWVV